MMRPAVLASAVCVAFAATAGAQTGDAARVLINFNLAAQSGSMSSATTFTSDVFQESATVVMDQTVKSGIIYDGLAGFMLGSRFGIAANLSYWKKASDGDSEANVPHPVFYDRTRTLEGSVTGLRHEETWIAMLGAWRLPVSPAVDVMILGGPALAMVVHEIPTAATVTETSAGPDVRLSLAAQEKSLWGYHVGADVSYRLTRHVGFGGFARMTGASGHLGDGAKLDLGGFLVGGGLRLTF
jgi:hypothetical protein